MVSQSLSVSLKDALVTRRGKAILGPVSFDLPLEGLTMVLGPNGAGKSTLLKLLHGVERLSGGQVEWSVPDAEARQSQAFIFQTPIMLRRTVRQNLAYPLQLLGYDKHEIAQHVQDWAARIGLTEALDRRAPRLSGGERQKLAIGRAMIRAPKVLFLDEPCSNLDGRSTREIETLLLDAMSSGTKIVMTSHDMGQAKRLAHQVVFLLNGAVLENSPADAFFADPTSAKAKAFLAGDIIE